MNANGGIRARRPRYGHAARAVSATIAGTNSSDAYLLATASATTGVASRYSGHRNAAVRTTIQVPSASRQSAGAS